MRDKAAHQSYARSRAVLSLHGPRLASGTPYRRPGFTLIELVVALAILMIIMIGVLSSVAFAYTSSMQNEQLNVARSVASYGVEYLRARTVTHTNLLADANPPTMGSGQPGCYRFTDTGTNGAFPSIVDAWGLPLQSWGHDCLFSKAHVLSDTSVVDGSANTDGSVIRFSSRHPALPEETYADVPWAWSSTLQGFNSVRDLASISALAAEDPCGEDANLQRTTGGGNNAGYYRSVVPGGMDAGHLAIVFPGTYVDAANPGPVTTFQALGGYVPMIYTTDTRYTSTDEQVYDPHYTNNGDLRTATQAYRGYRLLSTIVARKPTSTLTHVQYYDVTVTVFWMTGTRESRYALSTQIVAY
jgi:type II secretory pathway pseudopilin PulG